MRLSPKVTMTGRESSADAAGADAGWFATGAVGWAEPEATGARSASEDWDFGAQAVLIAASHIQIATIKVGRAAIRIRFPS